MPGCARRALVRRGEVGLYHCVSRCVRRAFLCGEDALTGRSFEHRRAWVRDRLEELVAIFAVEVCGFAVMANHCHVLTRVRPDRAASWSADELARRWWRLYPRRRDPGGGPAEPTTEDLEAVLAHRAGGHERVAELRDRLSDLSWFMKSLNEPIARRANEEDGCTGRFWEGRFKSQAVLDEGAALACGMYIDLNPIRAGVAETPETSDFTSAQERIRARQAEAKLEALDVERPDLTAAAREAIDRPLDVETQRGSWLCPIGGEESHLPGLSIDRYLELLDWTGRQVAAGKRGAIPASLAPILERLDLDVRSWVDRVCDLGRRFRRVIGRAHAIVAEAARAGRRWLHGLSAARSLFREAPSQRAANPGTGDAGFLRFSIVDSGLTAANLDLSTGDPTGGASEPTGSSRSRRRAATTSAAT